MRKNGHKDDWLKEKFQKFDENNPPSWEADTSTDIETASRIRELLAIPPVEDMPGVMARAVFKNERQRLAAVKLHKRHIKFGDNDNEEALRAWCASTIGEGGLGRFEASMASVGLWAPDSYRVVRGDTTKHKKEETVMRGSDYNDEDREKIEVKK